MPTSTLSQLTERWTQLRYHAEQNRLWNSSARFKVTAAGRRSGKTDLGLRFLVAGDGERWKGALLYTANSNGLFIVGAPTREQGKTLFWEDLKALVPSRFIAHNGISESELSIRLVTGVKIRIIGFDKPQRAEGKAIDGALLDEYAEMRPTVWTQTLRPALSTDGRPGWCWFIGRPRGRNHFWQLRQHALTNEDWDYFHWVSADIIDAKEIEAAKRDLDPLEFKQEYEASFVNFEGRVYYPFEMEIHAASPLIYNPLLPLAFCFDFNVEPGSAVVLQEQNFPGLGDVTCIIGEVHIPRNSNTPAVCRKLIEDWGDHAEKVTCYGDYSGGARHTSQRDGTDWDQIEKILRPKFGGQLRFNVVKNPAEVIRVNALNHRLMSADNEIHMLLDPGKASKTCEDLEGVTFLEGGAREIDKRSNRSLTHWSDALGYYCYVVHPIRDQRVVREQLY